MKPKTVVLLGVAVVCGLIAAFLVSMATATNKPEEKVTVLVAAQELRQGVVLSDIGKQFVQTQVSPTGVPATAIMDPKQLEGMVMLRTLDKGQIPTVGAVGKYEGLDKNLPPGHRAFTVRIQSDTGNAGFILPGAHVDLIATMQDLHNKQQKLTKTFMQNVLVLAINTVDTRDEKSRTVNNPSTATLALTPAQVERVGRVVSEGTVSLALRKPDDKTIVRTAGNSNPFIEDPKPGAEGDRDLELFVAAKNIPAGTNVTEENFAEWFETKRFSKGLAPESGVQDRNEIFKAKGVHRELGKGEVLTQRFLVKEKKEVVPEGPGAPPSRLLVQRIVNGQQEIVVEFRGNTGTVTGAEERGNGAGANPNVPGSEGK